jgi:ectoine hydroxylase-related dioxygenase (phytanoyl-CoA dioxygenase family)
MSHTGLPRDDADLRAQFDRDGYLVIDRLVSDATVRQLRDVYDAMIRCEIDCAGTDGKLGDVTRQIMMPSAHSAVFRDNEALDAARKISIELLGVENPVTVFDMLIYKPPGHPHSTPWHQDFAYSSMPYASAGASIPPRYIVQFWLALDDADETTGCMHFIPGVHRQPLLPHIVANGRPDQPGRLLGIDHPERHLDLTAATACPLRAGGCTVHAYGTPHFTPPNISTTRHRRAYIFNFADPRSVVKDPATLRENMRR